MEPKGGIPIVKPIQQDLQVFSSSKIIEGAGVKLIKPKPPGLRQILSGLKWGLDWNLLSIIRSRTDE